jgi:hypothetical protein
MFEQHGTTIIVERGTTLYSIIIFNRIYNVVVVLRHAIGEVVAVPFRTVPGFSRSDVLYVQVQRARATWVHPTLMLPFSECGLRVHVRN